MVSRPQASDEVSTCPLTVAVSSKPVAGIMVQLSATVHWKLAEVWAANENGADSVQPRPARTESLMVTFKFAAPELVTVIW